MHRAQKPVIKQPFNLQRAVCLTRKDKANSRLSLALSHCWGFAAVSFSHSPLRAPRQMKPSFSRSVWDGLHPRLCILIRFIFAEETTEFPEAPQSPLFLHHLHPEPLRTIWRRKMGKKLPVPHGNGLGEPLPSDSFWFVFSGWMEHCCLCNEAMALPVGIKKSSNQATNAVLALNTNRCLMAGMRTPRLSGIKHSRLQWEQAAFSLLLVVVLF